MTCRNHREVPGLAKAFEVLAQLAKHKDDNASLKQIKDFEELVGRTLLLTYNRHNTGAGVAKCGADEE